jgi:hypothetical protein
MGNTESSPHRKSKAEFRGAGCVFTNGHTVLAGYQKKKGDIIISGLGGSREEGESYMDTALRETIEELFHVKEVPPKCIETLKKVLKPVRIRGKEVEDWGMYITVIYTFEQLETLLKYAEKANIKGPLYDTFPKTVSDLLLKRRANRGSSPPEIVYLTIIPSDSEYLNSPIQPEFLEDIAAIHKK